MKETIKEEDRKALVDYRLQRAVQALKEAQYNADGEYFNTAINRLYYACFYAASALLLKNHLECNTHAGVKTQLGLHFIRTGILDKSLATTFSKLFDNRQSGDYEDFVFCDPSLYEYYKPKAEVFVSELSSLINSTAIE